MKHFKTFFSISTNFVLTGIPMPYDLFVNSSTLSEKEKFVRIFPQGGLLSAQDLSDFKIKYHQLYVPEEQRGLYLKAMVKNKDAPEKEKAKVIKDSAIHYLDSLFDKNKEFTTEVLKETIQGCRDSVESMVDVLQEMDVRKIQDLIADLSFHDFYTYDHSINVAMYSIGIYKEAKPQATRAELVEVGLGGLLHDLGKIKIPNHIINNPGKLTDQDFAEIKKHPDYGLELINQGKEVGTTNFNLDVVKRVVHEHHENFNGTGYPCKLAGNQIHLYARIAAIADFFDALTTKRSYHEVLTVDEALGIMAKSTGKKLDPKLFDVFVRHLKKMTPAGGKLELPDDFDPCQPHEELPFKTAGAANPNDPDFGKVTYTSGFTKKNVGEKTGSINKELLDKLSDVDDEDKEDKRKNKTSPDLKIKKSA